MKTLFPYKITNYVWKPHNDDHSSSSSSWCFVVHTQNNIEIFTKKSHRTCTDSFITVTNGQTHIATTTKNCTFLSIFSCSFCILLSFILHKITHKIQIKTKRRPHYIRILLPFKLTNFRVIYDTPAGVVDIAEFTKHTHTEI